MQTKYTPDILRDLILFNSHSVYNYLERCKVDVKQASYKKKSEIKEGFLEIKNVFTKIYLHIIKGQKINKSTKILNKKRNTI